MNWWHVKKIVLSMVLACSSVVLTYAAASATQSMDLAGSLNVEDPWWAASLHSWKEYLKEKPAASYLPEKQSREVAGHIISQWGNSAFSATGNLVDPAHIVFGKDRFLVQDAFAASALITRQEVGAVKSTDALTTTPLEDVTKHYLHILADQQLSFDSSYNQQAIELSYEQAVLDGALVLKLVVPFVRREHFIELSKDAEISPLNRTILTSVTQPSFYSTYNEMRDFITKVLGENGIMFKKSQKEIGIGDLVLSGKYRLAIQYTDDASIGASLTLNTSKVRRGVAVWEPNLGNEGAAAVHVCGHAAWHRGNYVNPFVSMDIGYNLPVHASRRVPYLLSYDGQGKENTRFLEVFPRVLPWSEQLLIKSTAFSAQPETGVREFASHLQSLKVNKGFEGSITIGNSLEQCFQWPIYAGISYQLFMRQAESLSDLDTKHKYDTSVVTQNTFNLGQTISINGGYRFSNDSHLGLSTSYRFAGRNMMSELAVNLGLAINF